MLNFREELSRIKEQKMGNIEYNSEDVFKRAIIPFFEESSLEDLEKGIEIFVHYHEKYFLIGAKNRSILRLDSEGAFYPRTLVEQIEEDFKNAGYKILEKFPDGFSVRIKA